MSQSIRNYNLDDSGVSWNIRDYDSEVDQLSQAEFYSGQDNFDVTVAELDGEIAGYVAYGEDKGHGILDLIELKPKFRGLRENNRTISKDLAQYAFDELEEDNPAVMIQAKALQGPVQRIAENNGYEVSGFQIEDNLSTSETENGDSPELKNNSNYSGEGFTAEMWKIDDVLSPLTIDAYLSQEFKDAVDASLPSQMDVNYMRPGAPGEGDFNYTGTSAVGHDAVRAERELGEKKPEEMIEEITDLESRDNTSWIYSVDLDMQDPIAYPLSEGLAEEGWRLVNLSPNFDDYATGATATIAKPNLNAGSYHLTPETMEFVKSTDLPFRVEEKGIKSDEIVFNPENKAIEDVDNADQAEIDEFYEKVIMAD